MWIKQSDMPVEVREAMRGGTGSVQLQDVLPQGKPVHMRLMSIITLNPGDSIGYHTHDNETEIFYIASGQGNVDDNGTKVTVSAGDSISTGGGAGHSVACAGNAPLVMVAVIVTEA